MLVFAPAGAAGFAAVFFAVVFAVAALLSVFFAGSVLIEKVFEIPGMGLLSLDAVVGRDYMLFMGILATSSLLALLGRLLSDFCYLLIDPRIREGLHEY